MLWPRSKIDFLLLNELIKYSQVIWNNIESFIKVLYNNAVILNDKIFI